VDWGSGMRAPGVNSGGAFDCHGRAHAAQAARAGAVLGREHLEVVGAHPRLQGRSVVAAKEAALSTLQRELDRLLQLRALVIGLGLGLGLG